MPWFDYQCRECGVIEAWDTSGEQVVDLHCPHCDEFVRWERKWTAPHLGGMSSGEPPR